MKLKWKRVETIGVKAESNGLVAQVYSTQYGTYTSTKRFQWRVDGPSGFIAGAQAHSQKYAKQYAEEFLARARIAGVDA